MAVGDLSPWPAATAAASRTAALAALRAAGIAESSDDRLGAMALAAAAMVEQYAPSAPQALRNEAVVRFVGYLAQARSGAIAQEVVGPMTSTYPTNHAAMFRNSGAAALLSRWRVRRAGAIG